MKKMSYLVLLGLLGCAPATGASEPTAPAASGGEVAKAEPEMVCKREHVTGSSFSKRVCRPKGAAGGDQQAMEQMQRRSSTITQNGR